MLRFGNGGGKIEKTSWEVEVNDIDVERVPIPAKAQQLHSVLGQVHPAFVAVGHGFCLECEK